MLLTPKNLVISLDFRKIGRIGELYYTFKTPTLSHAITAITKGELRVDREEKGHLH